MEKRMIEEARYILDTKATIRETAKFFCTSKSTVHKDIHSRLRIFDKIMYDKVNLVLQNNYDLKHIRGGISTSNKYKSLKTYAIN